MMIFDASNRDECQTYRYRTNTPLQALVMMNDPTMIEASRSLADQLLLTGISPETLLDLAFRKIICRRPVAREKELLLSYWQQAEQEVKKNPTLVQQQMSVGNYRTRSRDLFRLAVAMQSIQIIYNLQEAITKT
jgi:hypothetical protein